MTSMANVTKKGTRVQQLKALALVIAESIDSGDETHSMAQLARQYRETIREIAELENDADEDVISKLIAEGEPGAD